MHREYEASIVGCILRSPELIHQTRLREEHFGAPDTRRIFRAMRGCEVKGVRIDYISLGDQDTALRSGEVMAYYDAVPSSANWQFYEGKILETYQRESIRSLGRELQEIKDLDSPVKFVETAEKRLLELSTLGCDRSIYRIDQLTPDAIQKIQERYELKGRLPGLSTGIPALDNYTGGLQDARFIVIGARPSEGKSALMLNMTCHIGLRERAAVGVISAESSNPELLMRVFSAEGRIDGNKLSMGLLGRQQFISIEEVATNLVGAPIYIYDQPNIPLTELRGVARQMKVVHDIRVLFIDYLQLIQHHDTRMPRHEQVADISKSLKQLAREMMIPVVCLAQLRRDAEGREPEMADLGESGQIERDADSLIFIFHPKEKEGKDADPSRLIIRKNRDGARGSVPVVFKREYVRFYEAERAT